MSDLTANPFCPLCFGTGSWEQGERCGCVKPLQEFTSHTVTAPAPKPEANADDIRADALEYAAQIADAHWPESGHVHQEGAISCQMSISVEIRRRKGVAYRDWKPTEHEIELLAAKDAEIARLTQERDAAIAGNSSRLTAMLYRSLERLSLAIEACARIGFEESKPTTNEAHGMIWLGLNDAQRDAELKLKHYVHFVKNPDEALELERVRAAVAEHAKGCCCNEQGPENCVRLAELQRREKELMEQPAGKTS
jgi:hypothetical protein